MDTWRRGQLVATVKGWCSSTDVALANRAAGVNSVMWASSTDGVLV